MVFVLVLILSAHLNAQDQIKPQYHFCLVSSMDYSITSGTISFSPPLTPAVNDTSIQFPSFEHSGLNQLGYSLGLCTDIPLDTTGNSWLKIATVYQQLTLEKVNVVESSDIPIIIDGMQTAFKMSTESKTSLSYSNLTCNIIYGMNIDSSPLRWSVGLSFRVLTNKNPVEQTYRVLSPANFHIVTPKDSTNWSYDNSQTVLTNTKTASQTASLQLGGVVGIDYSMNVGSFYLMPFVQYSMLFTTITKETPLRLHTLQAGIGASVYL